MDQCLTKRYKMKPNRPIWNLWELYKENACDHQLFTTEKPCAFGWFGRCDPNAVELHPSPWRPPSTVPTSKGFVCLSVLWFCGSCEYLNFPHWTKCCPFKLWLVMLQKFSLSASPQLPNHQTAAERRRPGGSARCF